MPDATHVSDPPRCWVRTYTGRKFFPLDPRPEDVNIFDIAHALSNMCRFGGHVREFYSVAEHSVRVSLRLRQMGESIAVQLWGLLHDAGEAYLFDACRPVKVVMPELSTIEGRIMLAICDHFELPPIPSHAVHQADNELLVTEARDLLPRGVEEWEGIDRYPPPLKEVIRPWSAGFIAEERFLRRFAALRAGVMESSWESTGAIP